MERTSNRPPSRLSSWAKIRKSLRFSRLRSSRKEREQGGRMPFGRLMPQPKAERDAHGRLIVAGASKHRFDIARSRLVLVMGAFGVMFALISGRLVMLGMTPAKEHVMYLTAEDKIASIRPDLVDRNGEVLATDVKSPSLYADPLKIIDVDEAAEKLVAVLPDLDLKSVRRKLSRRSRFEWLKRELTHEQRLAVHRLGIPGLHFLSENKRFYPGGPTAVHILGHVNVDNVGLAGMEKYVDTLGLKDLRESGLAKGTTMEPVRLSVDVRVQHAVREQLLDAMTRYKAIAATGVVLDVDTGEVLAMSSVPDYDPNTPKSALEGKRYNRVSAMLYEMGSVFKTMTTAMALESGAVDLQSRFDARKPIVARGKRIRDFHAKRRILSVPEIFIYSSNIGTAKMAMKVGVDTQRDFLAKLGLLSRLETELPGSRTPSQPPRWTDLASMTVSFGHGLSVTPLQTAAAGAALMNGGYYIKPTFLPRSQELARQLSQKVVSERTSAQMRQLMRLNAIKGSGKRADIYGYRVGGKTGTAEKVVNKRYSKDKRFNSFLASFPLDKPRYVLLVTIDEPKPEKGAKAATAGLNAAPTAGRIIKRIAPMLGVLPKFDQTGDSPKLVSY